MQNLQANSIQNVNKKLAASINNRYYERFLLYGFIVFVLRYSQVENMLSENTIGCLYSISIAFLASLEIYCMKGKYILFHPTVICSVVIFILGFSVSNYDIYLGANPYQREFSENLMGSDYIKYINEGMFWANVALIALWLGFHQTKISNMLFRSLMTQKLLKYIKKDLNFNMPVVNAIYGISIFSRVFLIANGVFGFAGAAKGNGGGVYDNILGLMAIFVSGGSIGLLVYSIRYFNKTSPITMMLIACGLEIFFGILSGFKSGLIYPVVIIMFGYIVVHKTLNYRSAAIFLVCGAFLTVVAFNIVENFRKNISDTSANIEGVDSLVGFTLESNKNVDVTADVGYGNMSTLQSTLARANLSIYNALAFKNLDNPAAAEYAAQTQTTEKILLSPVYFLIPRFLWSGKPQRQDGSLFYFYFMGANANTSISPSTIGYISMIYSTWFIIPAFLLIGILQNVAFSFSKIGFGGLIITFSLLAALAFIDEFDFILINMFRNFAIALVAQYYLLNK